MAWTNDHRDVRPGQHKPFREKELGQHDVEGGQFRLSIIWPRGDRPPMIEIRKWDSRYGSPTATKLGYRFEIPSIAWLIGKLEEAARDMGDAEDLKQRGNEV